MKLLDISVKMGVYSLARVSVLWLINAYDSTYFTYYYDIKILRFSDGPFIYTNLMCVILTVCEILEQFHL